MQNIKYITKEEHELAHASSSELPKIKLKQMKRKKFIEIATRRANQVIDKIRSMENFTNGYYYEYNNQDIETMFEAIENQIAYTKGKLLKKEKKEFKL